MRSKIIFLMFFAVLGMFFSVSAVSAADYGLSGSAAKAGYTTAKAGVNLTELLPLIGQILGIVLSVIGVALFGLLLYGGSRWLIARGNSEDVQKAQDIVEAALIGMAIILISLGVGNWVIGKLVGGGSGDGSCIVTNTDNSKDCIDRVSEAECEAAEGVWSSELCVRKPIACQCEGGACANAIMVNTGDSIKDPINACNQACGATSNGAVYTDGTCK